MIIQRINKFMHIIAFLLAISWLLAGCRDGSSQEAQQARQAKETVQATTPGRVELVKGATMMYNKLLADGYALMNMNGLVQIATKKRAMKVYRHMAAFGGGQVRMEARLKKIEFISVRFISDECAEVRTEENWDYVYYSTETKEKMYENYISYLLTYQLIKQSGRWLVDDITIEKREEGPGAGELPFIIRSPDHPVGTAPRKETSEGQKE